MAIGFMSFGGMLTGGDEAPKPTTEEIVLNSNSEDYIDEEDQILMDTNNDIE